MKTYASLAMLKRKLAISDTRLDDDLSLALVAATRVVDRMVGDLDVDSDDLWTGDTPGETITLTVDPFAKASYVLATLAIAVRFHKGTDVPFGVAGMSDQGMVAYVRSSVPEAEILLAGERVSWGIG